MYDVQLYMDMNTQYVSNIVHAHINTCIMLCVYKYVYIYIYAGICWDTIQCCNVGLCSSHDHPSSEISPPAN